MRNYRHRRDLWLTEAAAVAVTLSLFAAGCCHAPPNVAAGPGYSNPATAPASAPAPRAIAVAPAVTRPTTSPFTALNNPLLHNAHVVTEKVVSGAQPEGEAAFAALQALGVKTIISVDGAKPDLALAHRYGMTYVHLPIGYDGVPAERGRELAKALVEQPGPIYVHCHHGKHRSAAAVAVACVENGTIDAGQAESVLQTFGTGANYKGLWRDARAARPLTAGELAAVKVEYQEAATVNDLAALMVRVDETFDRLKLIQKAGWKIPSGHPDLDPPHEALQLEEHFRESVRLAPGANRADDFKRQLAASEADAAGLRLLLAAPAVDAPAAEATMKRLSASCVSCHKTYRD